jgi:hypothetical protein
MVREAVLRHRPLSRERTAREHPCCKQAGQREAGRDEHPDRGPVGDTAVHGDERR